MAKIFIFFWCLAGLLTLDIALRAPHPRPATPPLLRARPGAPPVITAIQTKCELPAGTLVFVVSGQEP